MQIKIYVDPLCHKFEQHNIMMQQKYNDISIDNKIKEKLIFSLCRYVIMSIVWTLPPWTNPQLGRSIFAYT